MNRVWEVWLAIFEFQVSSAKFLAMEKTALQTAVLCSPPTIAVGPVQIVIDRIEFGDNSLRHNLPADYSIYFDELGQPARLDVPGFRTQLAQEVTVYVTALADLVLNANGPPSIIVPFQGTVVTDLQFYSGNPPDQNCYFAVSFTGVEAGPLPFLPPNFDPSRIPLPIKPDDIQLAVNTYLVPLFPPRTIPVDLLSELPFRPSKLLIVNAGVSIDQQMQRIAFRVEVGPADVNPDVPWQNFYGGYLDDRLQGSDFSLFLQGAYISSLIETLAYEAVSGALPDQLDLYITTTYSNVGGKAVFMNDVLGIYHLPEPFGSLESDPHIPIMVSMDAPMLMAVDAGVRDIKDLVDGFIPQWAKIFLRFAGPVGAFLQAMINSALSSLPSLNKYLPPQCKRTAPDNIHCTFQVVLPEISDSVGEVITRVLALDDGPAVGGQMLVTPYAGAPVEITANTFQFRPPVFSCAGAGPEIVAAFGNSPSSFNILYAEVIVRYEGTLPLYLCGVTPLNDPLGVFPANQIGWNSSQASLTITVHPPVPPPAYYASPYPCDLLVKTTGGARVMRIPPPPVLTQADADRLTAEMVVKLGNCEKLVDNWFNFHHGLNPKWGVDPMRGEGVMHLWQVDVRGLEPGATVTLVDSDRRELVRAASHAGEAVRVSALVAPSDGNELSILHAAGRTPAVCGIAATTVRRGLAITQQVIERLGLVPLSAPCRAVCAVRLSRKPCVLAVLQDGVVAFDLSQPNRPSAVARWSRPGIRGAVKWRGGLLFFGEAGLETVGEDGGLVAASHDCEAEGTHHAAAAAGFIYAASPAGIGVYTTRLCRVGEIVLEDCRSLISVAGKLVAAGRQGISIYDLSQPRHPRLERTHEGQRTRRLTRTWEAEAGSFLALLEDGASRLLRLEPHGILDAAVFERAPWFAGAARAENALVSIGPGGAGLIVSRFGPSNVT